MQDLSKMSVWDLCLEFAADLIGDYDQSNAVVAELTRRMTPPEGYVRLADGRDVKVLGTLARTADNCIAFQNSVVWHPVHGACYPVPDGLNVAAKVYGGNTLLSVSHCYSTREAAEAARAKEAK